MKIFKTKFWDTSYTSNNIKILIILALFLIIYSIFNHPKVRAEGVSLEYLITVYACSAAFIALLALAFLASQCFYITISDEELVVKGGIFGFLQRKFKLKDITYCELGNNNVPANYFQVYYNGGHSKKYIIQMVDKSYFPAMIEELNKHNIEVSIRGELK